MADAPRPEVKRDQITAVRIGPLACFCVCRPPGYEPEAKDAASVRADPGAALRDRGPPRSPTTRGASTEPRPGDGARIRAIESGDARLRPDGATTAQASAVTSGQLQPLFRHSVTAGQGVEDSLAWLNNLVVMLWPNIKNAIKHEAEATILPEIEKQMPKPLKNTTFTRFDLGRKPPELGPIRIIVDQKVQNSVEMRIAMQYLSEDVDVELSTPVANIGVRKLLASGELVLRFAPLIDEMPVIGGATVFFVDSPKLDIQFANTGLAKIAHYPRLLATLRNVVNKSMSKFLVLPNVIALPLGTEEQGVDRKELNFPEPAGVLRVTVLKATNLIGMDWTLWGKATSDPYVRVALGDASWESEVVKKNCSPVWTKGKVTHDFIVYDMEQSLLVDVYDEDLGKTDDHIGRAKPCKVWEALEKWRDGQPITLHSLAELEHSGDANEEVGGRGPPRAAAHRDCGTLELRLEWLEITDDAHEPAGAAGAGSHGQGAGEVYLVSVEIDEVFVPMSLGHAVSICAKIGSREKFTPMKTIDSAEEAATAVDRVLHEIRAKALDPDTISQIAGFTSKLGKAAFRKGLGLRRVADIYEGDLASDLQKDEQEQAIDPELEAAIEHRIYFVVTQSEIETETVQLSLVDGQKRPLASAPAPLREVAAAGPGGWPTTRGDEGDPYQRPEVQLRCTGGGNIASQIAVSARKLRKKLPQSTVMEEMPAAGPPSAEGPGPGLPRAAQTFDDESGGLETHSLEWLNEFFRKLWPHASVAIEAYVKAEATPQLQAMMPKPLKMARLKSFSLGQAMPVLGPIKLTKTPHGKGKEIRLGFRYESDVAAEIELLPHIRIGVRAFSFEGELVMRLEPLLDRIPVVGGVIVLFLDPPKLDLKFTGAAVIISHYPGIEHLLRTAAENMINKLLVLPNVIGVPLASKAQGVDYKRLNMPSPKFILRVIVLKAVGLTGSDWHLFGKRTSDPYVRIRLSADDWHSSVVKKTCDPVWTKAPVAHDFFVYDPEQVMRIDILDEDYMKSDLIGRVGPLKVTEVLAMSEKPIPIWQPDTDFDNFDEDTTQRCGSLFLSFESLEVPDEGTEAASCKVVSDSDADLGCMISVEIGEAFLPRGLGDKAAVMVTIGEAQKRTQFIKISNADQAANAVKSVLHGVKERALGRALDKETVHTSASYGSRAPTPLRDRNDESNLRSRSAVLQEIVGSRVEFESVLYFSVPPSTLRDGSIEISLLNGEMKTLGETSVKLSEVGATHERKWPRNTDKVELRCLRYHAEHIHLQLVQVRVHDLRHKDGSRRKFPDEPWSAPASLKLIQFRGALTRIADSCSKMCAGCVPFASGSDPRQHLRQRPEAQAAAWPPPPTGTASPSRNSRLPSSLGKSAPMLFLNLLVVDNTSGFSDTICKQSTGKFANIGFIKKAAGYLASRTGQLECTAAARALADRLPQLLPDRMMELGIEAEVEEVYRKGPFVVVRIIVVHCDIAGLVSMTKGGPEVKTEKRGRGFRFLRKAAICFGQGEIFAAQAQAVSNKRVVQDLCEKLPEVLPEKMKEKGLIVDVVAKNQAEEARFFFEQARHVEAPDGQPLVGPSNSPS